MTFVLDSIDRVYGNKPTVGIYHSLSTLLALLSFTEPYSGLVLFESTPVQARRKPDRIDRGR